MTVISWYTQAFPRQVPVLGNATAAPRKIFMKTPTKTPVESTHENSGVVKANNC